MLDSFEEFEENQFAYETLSYQTESLKDSLAKERSRLRRAIKKSTVPPGVDANHLLEKILTLTEQLRTLKKVNLKTLEGRVRSSTPLPSFIEFTIYHSSLNNIKNELEKISKSLDFSPEKAFLSPQENSYRPLESVALS